MSTVQIRKQGGAAIMTLPADMLKKLHFDVGDELALDLTEDGFKAKLATTKRKRYRLTELLKGATPRNIKALNESTKEARAGTPKGRELS